MAKKKHKKKAVEQKPPQSFWQGLSKTHQQMGAVVVLFLVLAIYFAPMLFEGLSPTGADVIGGIGKVHQIKEFEKVTGKQALWNPYVFSGMPLYYRLSSNISIYKILSSFSETPGRLAFVFYLVGALGMFFLTQYWRVPVWGSILASLAFVLMPHYEVLLQAGHYQKFRPIMLIPWVVLCFDYFLRKANLWGLIFFVLAFSTQLLSKHYQIVVYTLLILAFLGIGYLVEAFRKKEGRSVLKRLGLFALALVFSLVLSIQSLWPAHEYTPSSIRGGTSDKQSTGLDYEYATSWSFSPRELIKLLIPNAFGGASAQPYSGDAVPQLKGRTIPGYWGDMPFTEGGDYIGIATFVLALLGIIYGFRQRNRIVITLSLFIGFAFLLSFGRHFPLIYHVFFKTVPMFNKFRIPSMVLTAIYFSFACLAGFGFKAIFDVSPETRRRRIPIVIGMALFLVVVALTPYLFKSAFSFEKTGDATRYTPQILDLLKEARYDLMKQDATRLLLLALLSCAAIYVYLKNWVGKQMLFVFLTALLLFDLVSVDNRFLKNLGSIEQLEASYFAKTETDRFLLNDTTHYRIFPLQQNVFTNNDWSYHHQSIGGYDPAKLRIYQDVIEECIYKGWDADLPINWNVVNMLNTKYVVTQIELTNPFLNLVHQDRAKKMLTYENRSMLPRAFFVDSIEVIPQKTQRLSRLNDPQFDPATTAILEKDPNDRPEKPGVSQVDVVLYEPNRLELRVETDRKAFLVVSEIYYPNGWQATVDGEATEIFKTNHILRSILVPVGEHKVVFRFAPRSFVVSSLVSNITNGLLYLGLVVAGVVAWMRKRKSGSHGSS